MSRQRHEGFTLIELMITIVVLAILASIALPSFQNILENRRLNGAADNIYAFLSYAKSEAIKKNKTVRFQATIDGSTWCIGVDDDALTADCDCTTAVCEVDGVAKNITNTLFPGITMSQGSSVQFDRQGMASAQDFTVNISGRSKTVSVNAVGRVSVN